MINIINFCIYCKFCGGSLFVHASCFHDVQRWTGADAAYQQNQQVFSLKIDDLTVLTMFVHHNITNQITNKFFDEL